jgi:hypothetical protein
MVISVICGEHGRRPVQGEQLSVFLTGEQKII